MSDDQKIIHVSPDLLHFSKKRKNNKTKKVTALKSALKIKSPKLPQNTSTFKKNILNMIRKHQDSRWKEKTLENKEEEVKNEFKDSIDYFKRLKETEAREKEKEAEKEKQTKEKEKEKEKQYTLRQHKNENSNSNLFYSAQQIMKPKIDFIPSPLPNSETIKIQPPPRYGCLKNGQLPTYRVYHNKTLHTKPNSNFNLESTKQEKDFEKQLQEKVKKMSEQEQWNQIRTPETIIRKTTPKQKRILRRTFCIGKSKAHPKVAVLVSNRTIRSNTNAKERELKEVPIKDVKTYLLKHGLIKVGTACPNEILRKMFECANMVCGEVKNHNSENLLYNYFHSENENESL